MTTRISSLRNYFSELFFHSQQLVFILFDIVGIIIFFFPELASRLNSNIQLVRSIGGLIFIVSFIAANFLVFERLSRIVADKTEVYIDISKYSLEPKTKKTTSGPFAGPLSVWSSFLTEDEREERRMKELEELRSIEKIGLPIFGQLSAKLNLRNPRNENSEVFIKYISSRTFPFNLFDSNEIEPKKFLCSIQAKSIQEVILEYSAPVSQRTPLKFAKKLKYLVKLNGKYKYVFHYWSENVFGKSKTKKLVFDGRILDFTEQVTEGWRRTNHSNLLQHFTKKSG